MAIPTGLLLLGMLFLMFSFASAQIEMPRGITEDFDTTCITDLKFGLSRKSFPGDFIFGAAASAYQTEGHANKSCRGPSIWDTFTQDFPERIADGCNGDLGIDLYNRYESDLEEMKDMNMDAFRFSISWSRVIPSGKIRAGVNKDGIEFYNKLIDATIAKGLQPYATLFHWDVPQALEDKYGGFLSDNIVSDFRDFAELCFKEFGDRVKYWITLNEPQKFTGDGYDSGHFAPGRCSKWVDEKYCINGNSSTEPYIVAHNLLLSHAAAVHTYWEKYQASQNGKIGVTLNARWFEPYSNSTEDRNAAKRSLDFMLGWFLNPITYGDYPSSMRELVNDRLPTFSPLDSINLKGSLDFVGLNYYTAYYAANANSSSPDPRRYQTDSNCIITGERDDKPIGPQAGVSWQYIYPEGLQYMLNHIKDTYNNPVIYITENGYGEVVKTDVELHDGTVLDLPRVEYHCTHLRNVVASIKNHGVQVKGYFVWSFADNFEFTDGYTIGFGLLYVNRTSNFTRIAKLSSHWFTEFLGDQPANPVPLYFKRLNIA
ncbi:hypothetical protein POPTR_001G225808v4 [Populus trichocarpa]|uniref:Vacuolar protein sorting-associated protein 62 n=1 Tax=Populus trichocarpa TaxID=3694 RepID=A0A2K2C2D3_POPTR|nr:cyanogenic beta-glucosidase isoform X2 [Populus trichocarpa]PNT56188.2 hypothetical protein POPTR_001G225808v4 [Populus trichocarpa]